MLYDLVDNRLILPRRPQLANSLPTEVCEFPATVEPDPLALVLARLPVILLCRPLDPLAIAEHVLVGREGVRDLLDLDLDALTTTAPVAAIAVVIGWTRLRHVVVVQALVLASHGALGGALSGIVHGQQVKGLAGNDRGHTEWEPGFDALDKIGEDTGVR